MKTVVSRMDDVDLKKRLIIAGLIFLPLEAFVIFDKITISAGVVGQLELTGLLLLSVFALAFIDVLIVLFLIEFLEILGLLGIVYALTFTRIYTFKGFEDFLQAHLIIGPVVVFGLLGLNVLWQFSFLDWITNILIMRAEPHTVHERIYNNSNDGDDTGSKARENARNNDTKEPPPKHNKEELARLLNLWQMKYNQAQNDEGMKMANEKIREYQDELEMLKAESGTTPVRAISEKGGDKKWKK